MLGEGNTLSQDDWENIVYRKDKTYNKNLKGFYFTNRLKLGEFKS